MKKLLLLSALVVFACSSDDKYINAWDLKDEDGKALFLGKPFSGYAAYKGMSKYLRGYKRLKKGNICTVLIKYKNGNAIGLKQFYDNPTEIITIDNIEYEIGTRLRAEADEKYLITYFEDGIKRGETQIKWNGEFPEANGEGIQYNKDGSVKRKAFFKDGKIIKK